MNISRTSNMYRMCEVENIRTYQRQILQHPTHKKDQIFETPNGEKWKVTRVYMKGEF